MIFFTKKVKYLKKTKIIELSFNNRIKRRIKIFLKSGREAFLILQPFEKIHNGDIFSDNEEKEFIKIILAKEDLSVAFCKNNLLLMKACYHLGNRHILMQIKNQKLIYHQNKIIDNMIVNLGLDIDHIKAPFEPENGAYHI